MRDFCRLVFVLFVMLYYNCMISIVVKDSVCDVWRQTNSNSRAARSKVSYHIIQNTLSIICILVFILDQIIIKKSGGKNRFLLYANSSTI